jgi:hypothetical protein
MNCDLNVYNHITYKPLQDCDFRPPLPPPPQTLQNNSFMQEWRCQLFKFFT